MMLLHGCTHTTQRDARTRPPPCVHCETRPGARFSFFFSLPSPLIWLSTLHPIYCLIPLLYPSIIYPYRTRIVTVPYRTVPHRSQPHLPGGGGSRNAGSTRHELNRHFLHPTKTETKNSLPAPRQSFLPPSLFGFALLDWSLIEVGCSIGPRYL
jgi:hypothetical protein